MKRFDCEYAAVEADDGDFDGGTEEEVRKLVCEEDLEDRVRESSIAGTQKQWYVLCRSSSWFRRSSLPGETHCHQ